MDYNNFCCFFPFSVFTAIYLVTETAEEKSTPGNSGRDGSGPGLQGLFT
jgi:hypothetical protein